MPDILDTNWRSYVGPEDNGRTVDASEWQAPLNPLDYDDLLKGSRLQDFTVRGLEIPAAREDSIDFVTGRNLRFEQLRVHGSITLKGNLSAYDLTDCSVSGTIEIGQYHNKWHPGSLQPRLGFLTRTNSPHGKLRVKLWECPAPICTDSNPRIEWIVVPRVFARAYFLFRYFTNPKGIFRGGQKEVF